jgi:predicted DCC family thiol-disulfide oxidoreductase YuxK
MTDDLRRRCERALHLIPPGGEPVSAGKAALEVLSLLGWEKTAAFLSAAPMCWAVEAGYRLIARHRSLFGKFFAGK